MRITEALVRRITHSPAWIIETYPGEGYPVDNAAAMASIGLYDRARGADHGALLAEWASAFRARFIDGESGLLIQAVRPTTGDPVDMPRASGTALAAYFLSFADMELSGELYAALVRSCATNWIGFGLIREYPPGCEGGAGDIDSGPVVLGMSFSGTGFSIAASRIHGDRARYTALYRTARLVGAPLEESGVRSYVCGGPLGNAIMLAMLTAGAK